MIYLPLPFCRKKRFWPKKVEGCDLPFFGQKRGQVDHVPPPPGWWQGMIYLALFLGHFFVGALLGPKRLFWFFGSCCFGCCCGVVIVVLGFGCCFVVVLLFWLLLLWLFCCFVVVCPRTPTEKHNKKLVFQCFLPLVLLLVSLSFFIFISFSSFRSLLLSFLSFLSHPFFLPSFLPFSLSVPSCSSFFCFQVN